MNIQKGSTSDILLSILEKSVDGFLKLQDFRQHSGAYLYGDGRELPKSALTQAIIRLKQGGFVREVKVGNEIVIKLIKSANYITDHDQEEEWDGRWRIVTFDIPEEKRIARNLFRRNLKKWGFNPLQKSVWVSKKNVYKKLVTYIQDLKIKKWVIVIEADKISETYH